MIRTILISNMSLWGCLWQSTLFALLGLAASFLLRRQPARAHQVLLWAMLAAVLAPALSGVVRHFDLGLWAQPAVVPERVGPSRPLPIETGASVATAVPETPPTPRAPSPVVARHHARVPWSTVALWSWGAATCALFGRLLFAFAAGVRLSRRAQPLAGGPVVEALRLAQARLGVQQDLRLRKDTRVRSPVIWCWGRQPVLLLPDTGSGSGGETVWAGVIAHELAHWKRGDHMTGLFAELVVCALPWNPLLWWSKRHLVSLTEQACDDWVVASGQPAEDYAESLLGFRPQNRLAFVPAVVRGKSGVAFRVRRILNDVGGNPRTGTKWSVGVTVLLVCAALGVAFAQARPAEPRAIPAHPANTGAPASQITFTGRVIDTQGTPVAGARATLYRPSPDEFYTSSRTELLAEQATGADGTFTFAVGKNTEAYPMGFILVRQEKLALSWAAWRMEDDQRMDITLEQGKDLSGDVVDEKGQPITDAEVGLTLAMIGERKDNRFLASPMNSAGSVVPLDVKTDERGHFVFEGMPVGATFEFQVEKAGRATVRTFGSASKGSRGQFSTGQSGIKIVLPPEAIIQGVVVDKAGVLPIGGLCVIAIPRFPVRMIQGLSKPLGTDGVFRISGLGSGTYWVHLLAAGRSRPEWVAEPVPVTLAPGQTNRDVKLEITKGAIVEVLVKDRDGKPVSQTQVILSRVPGPGSPPIQQTGPHMQRTGEDGLARVRVSPGEYTCFTGRTTMVREGQVTVAEGETKRVEYVQGGEEASDSRPEILGAGGSTRFPGTPRIAGIVRDQAGNPLAGVEVQVVPTRMPKPLIYSDASGRFEIPADPMPLMSSVMPPVLVARDVAHNLAGSIEIGKTEGDLDLQLQPGLTITGTVLSEEGRPLAGGRINVMLRRKPQSFEQLGLREPIAIKADGIFEVKALPTDRQYTITAMADGYGRQSVQVNPQESKDRRWDTGPLKLPLAKLSITGVVVDPNDKPVAGATVSGSGEGQPSGVRTQTDAEGKFVLQGVCPGPIRLIVMPGGRLGPISASVQTMGGATDLRIVVHPQRMGQLSMPGGPQP